YIGIMYLGGTSVSTIGMVDNGGPILNSAAEYYFGVWGGVLLAIVIILACLTTAIGLTIATAEYLYKLITVIFNRGWFIILIIILLFYAYLFLYILFHHFHSHYINYCKFCFR